MCQSVWFVLDIMTKCSNFAPENKQNDSKSLLKHSNRKENNTGITLL